MAKKMTHDQIRKSCVPIFERFIIAGKTTATSDDFGQELIKEYPDLAKMSMTGLQKTIGDAFGKRNLPTTNNGYPKIYDLNRIEIENGDLLMKLAYR